MEKSHVGMETKICLVTGKEYETNSILLDKRLRKILDPKNVTGWGISPEVQEKFDEGYIVFVGVDADKSRVINNRITPENAYRTGKVAYLKKEVAKNILNVNPQEVNFAEDDFFDMLEKMQAQAES